MKLRAHTGCLTLLWWCDRLPIFGHPLLCLGLDWTKATFQGIVSQVGSRGMLFHIAKLDRISRSPIKVELWPYLAIVVLSDTRDHHPHPLSLR